MTPEQRAFLRSRFASLVNDEAVAVLIEEIERRMTLCDDAGGDDCMEAAIRSMATDASTSDLFLGFGVRSTVSLALQRAQMPEVLF